VVVIVGIDPESNEKRLFDGNNCITIPLDLTNCTGYNPSCNNGNCEYGHIKNGAMINPVAADDQAYDSLAPGYNTEKNVAFNIDAQNPLIVTADSSLISSISLDTDVAVRPQIDVATVLTVLRDIPPIDSFRPPYSGSNKSIRAVKSNINWTKLLNLPKPIDALSYDDLVTNLQMNKGSWIQHWDIWWERYVHPIQNMPDYGTGIARRTGEAVLALNLDYTQAEKELILIDYNVGFSGGIV